MDVKFLFKLSLLIFCCQSALGQVVPLPNAFAHNDYLHKRPLFEALDNGFTNIEADVFLRHDKLIVAHFFPYFKTKTLEELYFKPLADHIAANNGEVYTGYQKPIVLMIDIKSAAEKTYQAIVPLLEKYSAILSTSENGIFTPGLVTVVLSGHKPYNLLANETKHLAFMDADLSSLNKLRPNAPCMMASCKYSKFLKAGKNGEIPVKELNILRNLIAIAHARGEKVRLWASPDKPLIWKDLLACGVDYINTDKLHNLRSYLLAKNQVIL